MSASASGLPVSLIPSGSLKSFWLSVVVDCCTIKVFSFGSSTADEDDDDISSRFVANPVSHPWSFTVSIESSVYATWFSLSPTTWWYQMSKSDCNLSLPFSNFCWMASIDPLSPLSCSNVSLYAAFSRSIASLWTLISECESQSSTFSSFSRICSIAPLCWLILDRISSILVPAFFAWRCRLGDVRQWSC